MAEGVGSVHGRPLGMGAPHALERKAKPAFMLKPLSLTFWVFPYLITFHSPCGGPSVTGSGDVTCSWTGMKQKHSGLIPSAQL